MDAKLQEALAKLPQKERAAIEKEARHAALSKMSTEERREILSSAQYMRESIYMVFNLNNRRPQPFGDESALELLSKVGQWMNDNEITPETEIEDIDEFIEGLKAMGIYSDVVR